MSAYVVEWLSLLARWLHLITGIAWIGASFYFVWLDNHLKPSAKNTGKERGVHGDLWSVHGGGFYHNEKFLLGPQDEPLSEELHWFKWEAYWTWLSGMMLLGLVYWHGASTYLIDKSIADLSVAGAIAISMASIVSGWLVYDGACRLIKNDYLLSAFVLALIVVADVLLFQVFSARAAYIHVGTLIGTIMVANVLMVIIPGQKKMVTAIRAGLHPDPQYGLRGKQRSVHNTYLTLPVLFIMTSSHYPMAYNHRYGWLVLIGILVAGVLIRQFFILRHKNVTVLWLPVAGIALLLASAWAIAPRMPVKDDTTATKLPVSTTEIAAIIKRRCTSCHSIKPTDTVFVTAPLGVMYDTPQQIEALADKIYQRAVISRDMPLVNGTNMSDEERALIGIWYQQRRSDTP